MSSHLVPSNVVKEEEKLRRAGLFVVDEATQCGGVRIRHLDR